MERMKNLWIKTRLFVHRLLTTQRFGYLIIAGILFIPLLVIIACNYLRNSDLHDLYYLFNFNYPENSCHSNVSSHVWRYFLIGVFGMFMATGILMMLFTNGIQRWVERIREGRKEFKWIGRHYVMIGYNHFSINIINKLILSDNRRLVILTQKNPVKIRAELQTLLVDRKKERHVVICAGGQDRINTLNLGKAVEAYIMVEGKEWENQYTHSMAILEEVAKSVLHRESQLKTNLYIDEVETYNMIGRLGLPRFEGIEKLDVHPFNMYDNWARLLWSYNGLKNKNGEYVYEQLDFEPIVNSEKHVHLVIVGFNSMGKALWQEAVRIAHYPNFDESTGKNKTIITVIDPNCESIKEMLLAQYPNYQMQISDIQFEFMANRIEDPEIRKRLVSWAEDDNEMLTVAVCFSDADKSLSVALTLPEKLFFCYDKLSLIPAKKESPDGKQIIAKNYSRTRVLVRQAVKRPLNQLLATNPNKYIHVKFFGNVDDAIIEELLDDYLAICVNGIYSGMGKGSLPLNVDFYNIDKLKVLDINEHYDYWRNQWLCSVSEQNKLSSRYQIDHYRSTLPIMSQGVTNIVADKLAQTEHLRWIAERTLAGWRQKANDEKRVDELKIHTDIIPYSSLSDKEKIKDSNVVLYAKKLVEAQAEYKKMNS